MLIKFHIFKIHSCLQTLVEFYLPGKIKLKRLHFTNTQEQPKDKGEGLHPVLREACFLTSATERITVLTHIMPTPSSYFFTNPVNRNCSLGNTANSQARNINSIPCHLCLVLHQKPCYFDHRYYTVNQPLWSTKKLSLLPLLQKYDSSL